MAIDAFNLGPETLVNTTTLGSQESAGVVYNSPPNSLATLADGHIVAVWDDSSSGHVKARILSPDSPISSEIDIAAGQDAQVASLPDGNFAVLWTMSGAIKYQIFNNLGVAVSSVFTPLSSAFTYTGSSLAALSNGNILITTTYDSGATTSTAYATEFTPAGTFTGTDFSLGTVSTTSSSVSGNVDASELPNGNIAFTWLSGTGTINREVLTPAGGTVWSGIISNTGSNPVVTALSNGNVVFAYMDTSGASPPDIKYEVLTSSGAGITGVQTATTVTTAGQYYPDIAATSNGGFVITWEDGSAIGGDNSPYAVKERAFDSSGNPLTGETLVNTETSGFQGLPSVTGLAGGGVYTTWADFSGLAVPGQTADTSPPGLKGQATEFYDPSNFAGAAQIFWDNTSDNVAVSPMNGVSQLGSTQSLGNVTSDWSIAGIGDLNGDGKSDILWHDAATNQYAVWLMNGSTVSSAQLLPGPTPDWSIAGVGDFNGDGKADILWRNTSGQDAIWNMNGATPTSKVLTASATTDWSVAGVGDFNGDGKADILWRNVNGQDAIWNMNGSVQLTAQYTNSATTDWQVAGVTDFNHDNHPDILWQNASGQLAIWEMNNATVLPTSKIVGAATPDWHPFVGSTVAT
jgi:DNA-binding CsgD family transcriptional regulator